MLCVMEWAAMVTAASGAAATVRVEAERGREYRAGGGDLAEPGIEHAADERGMFGNAHSGLAGVLG